jgi:hypothetical protein
MAFTLAQLRNQILTSIHGRRLGLDTDEFLVGSKGPRVPVAEATSDTTGTALPNHGIVSVVTTTDDTWTLNAPTPGCRVNLQTGSSSTGSHIITLTNATVMTTIGAQGNLVTLTGPGACVALAGLTTARWALVSKTASTALAAITS